jgi:hypothetical protein
LGNKLKKYLVKTRIYDAFGLVGTMQKTVTTRTRAQAAKAVDDTIAGQYFTSIEVTRAK